MTLKDATNEAIRDWCCHPSDTYYAVSYTHLAEIGATPWATDFYGANGFAVCDVSLGVSKDIKITDSPGVYG